MNQNAQNIQTTLSLVFVPNQSDQPILHLDVQFEEPIAYLVFYQAYRIERLQIESDGNGNPAFEIKIGDYSELQIADFLNRAEQCLHGLPIQEQMEKTAMATRALIGLRDEIVAQGAAAVKSNSALPLGTVLDGNVRWLVMEAAINDPDQAEPEFVIRVPVPDSIYSYLLVALSCYEDIDNLAYDGAQFYPAEYRRGLFDKNGEPLDFPLRLSGASLQDFDALIKNPAFPESHGQTAMLVTACRLLDIYAALFLDLIECWPHNPEEILAIEYEVLRFNGKDVEPNSMPDTSQRIPGDVPDDFDSSSTHPTPKTIH